MKGIRVIQRGVSKSKLNELLGVKVITPIVCQLCEMDWQNGACGDCTLTRKQLEGCKGLQRQIDLLVQMTDNLRKQLNAALNDTLGNIETECV